jgi:hypothetical protein
MKTLRIFILGTFILSVLAGFYAGTYIFQKKKASIQTPYQYNNTSTIPGKQGSIWLIVVDGFNEQNPHLEGVWLIAYITNYIKIKPLPLFPSGDPTRDDELAKAFQFTPDKKIAATFWDYLQNHGQVIHDYIVFDEVAVVEIINTLGGVNIRGRLLNGIQAMLQTPETWVDPIGSYRGQVAIMDSLCKSILRGEPLPDLYKLQNKIKNHLRSNLDLENKTKEWQKIIMDGNIKICDFNGLYEKPFISSKP